MRKKYVPFMVILFIALLGYYLIVELPSIKQQKKLKKFKFFSFNPEKVEYIETYYRDFVSNNVVYKTVLVKSNNNWVMVYPVPDDADQAEAESFLLNLSKLKSDLYSTNKITNWNVFGFDKPNALFKVVLDSGETQELQIGNLASFEDYYFAKTSRSPLLFFVAAYKVDPLEKKPDSFRSDIVFTISDIDEAKSFEYTHLKTGEVYKFIKTNNVWQMVKPVKLENTDSHKVERWLEDFAFLKIKDFTSLVTNKSNLRKYKLDVSDRFVKLHFENGVKAIWFGKKQGIYVYSYATPRKYIFAVDKDRLEDLLKKDISYFALEVETNSSTNVITNSGS